MARWLKKMAAEQLLLKQCKIILKWYWKSENVFKVHRQWQYEFGIEPAT
jgi:hypothetical protein